jgi:hypothetical protein
MQVWLAATHRMACLPASADTPQNCVIQGPRRQFQPNDFTSQTARAVTPPNRVWLSSERQSQPAHLDGAVVTASCKGCWVQRAEVDRPDALVMRLPLTHGAAAWGCSTAQHSMEAHHVRTGQTSKVIQKLPCLIFDAISKLCCELCPAFLLTCPLPTTCLT